MIIELEEFSLSRIIPQFREFNSATRNNRLDLVPYFWWASANNFTRFKFIFCSTLVEKMAHFLCDLPYNKKFIVRKNGEFAGIVGLDMVSQDALSSEVWMFIDRAHRHCHIASGALKLLEDYAQTKSVHEIRAYTSSANQDSKNVLVSNDYVPQFRGCDSIVWHKRLNTKVIEK